MREPEIDPQSPEFGRLLAHHLKELNASVDFPLEVRVTSNDKTLVWGTEYSVWSLVVYDSDFNILDEFDSAIEDECTDLEKISKMIIKETKRRM